MNICFSAVNHFFFLLEENFRIDGFINNAMADAQECDSAVNNVARLLT